MPNKISKLDLNENKNLLNPLSLNLKFSPKIFYKHKNKMKEFSSIIDNFLITILKKANKFSEMANRDKITYFDLINAINENQFFLFDVIKSPYFLIFSKNNKSIINNRFNLLSPVKNFKKICKRFQIFTVFQSWFKLPRKKKLKKEIFTSRCIFHEQLTSIPLNELIFLCYFIRTLSRKKIHLALISNCKNIQPIFGFIFFWVIHLSVKKKNFSISIKIIYALNLNNEFFVFKWGKKLLSILLELILENSFEEVNKNGSLFHSSIKIIEPLNKIFLKTSPIFYFKIKYILLGNLIRSKKENYNRSNPSKTFDFFFDFGLLKELFISPFLTNLK